MSGMTLAEKILARKTGRRVVYPGEVMEVEVDLALTHDVLGPLFFKDFESFNIPIWDPDRVIITIDHFSPPSSEKQAQNNKITMDFVRKYGIKHHYYHEGPSHQVVVENGHARPGLVMVGTDSHTCTAGAFGGFSTGIGSTEMLSVFLSGKTWFRVPETIKVIFDGMPVKGVMAKDMILELIRLIGAEGATYKALEFSGSGVKGLSIDSVS